MKIKILDRIFISKRKSPLDIFLDKHLLVGVIVVILLSTLIFALRNMPAFTYPNFYAEDATVLFQNIFSKDIFHAILAAFNGYLVVGQYILAYIAATLNLFLGGEIKTLPLATAIISSLFMGTLSSLPVILFRKNLGTVAALLAVLLTSLVPLKSYDYAILGSIANLKFVFLYLAFMLVLYRLINRNLSTNKIIIVDALLVICILSNATVAFLVPLILLPYVKNVFIELRKKLTLRAFRNVGLISGLVISAIGAVYTLVALLKGIPKIPGYLDTPFKPEASFPILDRSMFYSLFYPITPSVNSVFVALLFIATITFGIWVLHKKNDDSYVMLAGGWGIFLGTVLFIINRPGIGDYYLSYGHKGGPDQFFMAQNMIFIFLVVWFVRKWFNLKTIFPKVIAGFALVLYLVLAIPHGTSYGSNSEVYYKSMGSIYTNVDKACSQYAEKETVVIQIYPIPYWQWHANHDLVCE